MSSRASDGEEDGSNNKRKDFDFIMKVKLPDITEVPDVTQKSLVREH